MRSRKLTRQEIVEVPAEDLRVLTQESPGTARGIQRLEKAAASIYKALQAGMDTGKHSHLPLSRI
jgi:hypothetical protein